MNYDEKYMALLGNFPALSGNFSDLQGNLPALVVKELKKKVNRAAKA